MEKIACLLWHAFIDDEIVVAGFVETRLVLNLHLQFLLDSVNDSSAD